MNITKFVTKRKPSTLVVPEGVKGSGWEALRKAISLVQEFTTHAVSLQRRHMKIFRRVRAFTEDVGPMQMLL